MLDDRALVDMVKRAYEERKARYIKKEELLGWLKTNGLTLEQARTVIHIAIKQHIIRFCYPSSIGGKELVPCYERITEEDLLPPELMEEMRKKIIQREYRAMKMRKKRKE